jgi:putative ATP-binding cassette transporter
VSSHSPEACTGYKVNACCSYYILEAKKEIDNPDQRIAEDVRAFTQTSLSFSITLLTSVIDLCSFATILYSIYPPLFGAIILYAGFGTASTLYIGKQLVGLNYEQLQREADFRFSMVRMRENAESIAFYGGEAIEMKEIKRRLNRAMSNFFELISVQRNLDFFTVAYRYMVQVLPMPNSSKPSAFLPILVIEAREKAGRLSSFFHQGRPPR